MTMKPAIEIKGYCYTYLGAVKLALKELSLSVDAGECVCLSGPSGSGKTTLFLAVKGLLEGGHSPGSIKVARSETGAGVGIVFQNAETRILCTTVEDEGAWDNRRQ